MRTLKTDDPRVKAIRDDKNVGWGSCTSIDECMEDVEIVKALDEEGIKTPEDAIKWAYEVESIHLEEGLNQRWGEDDDPQLTNYREFKKQIE